MKRLFFLSLSLAPAVLIAKPTVEVPVIADFPYSWGWGGRPSKGTKEERIQDELDNPYRVIRQLHAESLGLKNSCCDAYWPDFRWRSFYQFNGHKLKEYPTIESLRAAYLDDHDKYMQFLVRFSGSAGIPQNLFTREEDLKGMSMEKVKNRESYFNESSGYPTFATRYLMASPFIYDEALSGFFGKALSGGYKYGIPKPWEMWCESVAIFNKGVNSAPYNMKAPLVLRPPIGVNMKATETAVDSGVRYVYADAVFQEFMMQHVKDRAEGFRAGSTYEQTPEILDAWRTTQEVLSRAPKVLNIADKLLPKDARPTLYFCDMTGATDVNFWREHSAVDAKFENERHWRLAAAEFAIKHNAKYVFARPYSVTKDAEKYVRFVDCTQAIKNIVMEVVTKKRFIAKDTPVERLFPTVDAYSASASSSPLFMVNVLNVPHIKWEISNGKPWMAKTGLTYISQKKDSARAGLIDSRDNPVLQVGGGTLPSYRVTEIQSKAQQWYDPISKLLKDGVAREKVNAYAAAKTGLREPEFGAMVVDCVIAHPEYSAEARAKAFKDFQEQRRREKREGAASLTR